MSSSNAGDSCYIDKIFELIKNNQEIDFDTISKYLNNRYNSNSIELYFNIVLNNISEILSKPEKYTIIVEPLTNNLRGNEISFDQFLSVLDKTTFLSLNNTINNFILKIVEQMKNCLDFNIQKYNDILSKIGIQYNNSNIINNEFKIFVKKYNLNEQKIIFGYNTETNSFDNFTLLKNCEDVFDKKEDNLFETISNSYCIHEDYVIASDLERHGFIVSRYKEAIKHLLKNNINKTIYLCNIFTEEEINSIDMEKLDTDRIDFTQLKNKYLKLKFIKLLKYKITKCIDEIKKNKDNKEIVIQQVSILLNNCDNLYCKLNFSDRTLWSKLKIVDKYISYHHLEDSFYYPNLKEHEDLINLFYKGKYKENYFKDNIFADKTLNAIK